MFRPAFASFVLAIACACAPASGGPPPASDRSTYPEGPFGTAQGDVIADLTFVDSSGAPWSLRDIQKDPHNRLLLLSTAAGWCTACIEEQGALEELHVAHAEDGLAVMVALFEDRDFQPASEALAEAWRTEHELTFHVVADPEFQLGDYYDPSLTPMNMIIDVNNMEMLVISTGWDRSAIESVIGARL